MKHSWSSRRVGRDSGGIEMVLGEVLEVLGGPREDFLGGRVWAWGLGCVCLDFGDLQRGTFASCLGFAKVFRVGNPLRD